MQDLSPFALGATLYMPATRDDLVDAVLFNKIEGLRSLVICLEDAVAEKDVQQARRNLASIVSTMNQVGAVDGGPLVFIRPRDVGMAAELVDTLDLRLAAGFVLPKFNLENMAQWQAAIGHTHLRWMPTLETADVFDALAMRELAEALDTDALREKILALRIGGNDLMNVLGIRRSRTETLYEGPLAYVFKMLVSTFASRGFALTAPVCEVIDTPGLLERELLQDVAHGLVGKTAIHPSQIAVIHRALSIETAEYQDALRILNSEQAVFKNNGAMCEPTTHRRWASNILTRARIYGVSPTINRIDAKSAAHS